MNIKKIIILIGVIFSLLASISLFETWKKWEENIIKSNEDVLNQKINAINSLSHFDRELLLINSKDFSDNRNQQFHRVEVYRVDSRIESKYLLDSLNLKFTLDTEHNEDVLRAIDTTKIKGNKFYLDNINLTKITNIVKKRDGSRLIISLSEHGYDSVFFAISVVTPYSVIWEANLLSIITMVFYIVLSPISAWYIGRLFDKSERDKERLNTIQKLVDKHLLVSRTNEDNLIVYANEKFCNVAGYTMEELYHKNHNILNSGDKGSWKDFYDSTNDGNIYQIPMLTNIGKNKEYYFIDFSGIKNANGKGHTRLSTDLTELVRSKQEIEEKNNINEKTGYSLRHDLKNPLIVFNKYFERIVKKLSEEDLDKLRLTGTFKVLCTAKHQLNEVYNGLYDWSMLGNKGLSLPMEKYNLKTVLDTYLKNTIFIDYTTVKATADATFNKSLIINVIDNLLRNSVSYNNSLDKRIEIYQRDNDLIIDDNGIGMSSEQYAKFKQSNVRGSMGKGTGLGLSISSLIVKKHNFELTCENKKGKGTRMVIKNIFKT